MTLTLDMPPAEEAELRRLATAGDLPAVRAKLAGRLDELAAGLARPVGPTEAPPAADVPRTVAGLPVPGADPEFDRRAAEIAAGYHAFAQKCAADYPPDMVPLTNEQLRRVNMYDD